MEPSEAGSRVIEGLYFEDEKIYEQAEKEYAYINKMRPKMVNLTPNQLAEFYHKLLEKQIFNTQIGYTFLYEIRSTLIEQFGMYDEDLAYVEIPAVKQAPPKTELRGQEKRLLEEVASLKKARSILSALAIILAVVIIGFFVIIATNQDIGYINTENKILNKYANWEQELNDREAELDLREQQLEEQEKK